jgi:hypothetical protein
VRLLESFHLPAAASGSGNHYFYSLNVGPVHFAVLDTLPYLDLGPQDVAPAQARGLSVLQVSRTPWTFVSHICIARRLRGC